MYLLYMMHPHHSAIRWNAHIKSKVKAWRLYLLVRRLKKIFTQTVKLSFEGLGSPDNCN